MDFTAFTMQDQYRAILQERERELSRGSWRRQLKQARRGNAAACCGAYDHAERAALDSSAFYTAGAGMS